MQVGYLGNAKTVKFRGDLFIRDGVEGGLKAGVVCVLPHEINDNKNQYCDDGRQQPKQSFHMCLLSNQIAVIITKLIEECKGFRTVI